MTESEFRFVSTKLLGIDNLELIFSKCKSCASKWEKIGLRLGLGDGLLRSIKDKSSDQEACLREAIAEWLKQNYTKSKRCPRPSWQAICIALSEERVDCALALDIAADEHEQPQPSENTEQEDRHTKDSGLELTQGGDCGCGECIVENLHHGLPCPKPSKYRKPSVQLQLTNGGDIQMEKQIRRTEHLIKQFNMTLAHTLKAIYDEKGVDLRNVWAFAYCNAEDHERDSSPDEASTSFEAFVKFVTKMVKWYHFELVADMAKTFISDSKSCSMWSKYRKKLRHYVRHVTKAVADDGSVIGVRMNEKYNNLNVTSDIPRLRRTLAKYLKIDRSRLRFITVLDNPTKVIFESQDKVNAFLTTDELKDAGATSLENHFTMPELARYLSEPSSDSSSIQSSEDEFEADTESTSSTDSLLRDKEAQLQETKALLDDANTRFTKQQQSIEELQAIAEENETLIDAKDKELVKLSTHTKQLKATVQDMSSQLLLKDLFIAKLTKQHASAQDRNQLSVKEGEMMPLMRGVQPRQEAVEQQQLGAVEQQQGAVEQQQGAVEQQQRAVDQRQEANTAITFTAPHTVARSDRQPGVAEAFRRQYRPLMELMSIAANRSAIVDDLHFEELISDACYSEVTADGPNSSDDRTIGASIVKAIKTTIASKPSLFDKLIDILKSVEAFQPIADKLII